MRLLSILLYVWMMKKENSFRSLAFICNLSFDVYVKKQLIEKMVDELPKPDKKNKSVSFFKKNKKERISDFEIRSFLLLSVWQ